MKFKNGNFILIGIASLSIILACAAAFYYHYQTSADPDIQLTEARVGMLINKFRTSQTPIGKSVFLISWREKMLAELSIPEAVLPDPARYRRKEIAALQSFGKECKLDEFAKLATHLKEHQRKWLQYYEFKCGKTKTIDKAVWQQPPLIHPLGGSWAHWLYKNGYGDKKWLNEERAYLHVLEYRDLPKTAVTHFERTFETMTPANLELLEKGAGIVATPSEILITSVFTFDDVAMEIYSRTEWDKYLKQNKLSMEASVTSNCDLVDRLYCWGIVAKKVTKISSQYFIIGMLILVAILGASLGFSVWRRVQEENAFMEKQQLVMQTMAHELRHPVTGLRLFIEAVRPSYDKLPEELKTDFLRAINISARMSRLVKFSQQYLQLLSSDKQFEFRQEQIASVNDFLESTLRDYAGKISIQVEEKDTACSMDGYWVSTCVSNLVVNALTHGAAPIVVSWERQDKNLFIHIQDAGVGPTDSFEKLTDPVTKRSKAGGMGLGLSLVNRIANLMNGSLSLRTNPTQFTVILKGVCHDENFVS